MSDDVFIVLFFLLWSHKNTTHHY